MKAIIPLLILSTVTMCVAIGVVFGLRTAQPQLFGLTAQAPATPAKTDSLRSAGVPNATAIRTDTLASEKSPGPAQSTDASTRLSDSLRVLTARLDQQQQDRQK